MKKSILLIAILFVVQQVYSQTTYYWIGGTGTTSNISFTSTSTSSPRWNTALNGSGTNRTVNDPTDILIVDGTNVGGATPTTGAITATSTSTAFGQLILRNGASMTLVRPNSGTGTITVNGDATAADDLLINAGCSLKITVADSVNTTSGNNLVIGAAAFGRVFGTLSLSGGASRTTASNPVAGGSLIFENGAVCKVNTQITYYPFGSNSGVPLAVVFNNGSTLVYEGGNTIWTSTSAYTPCDLKTGSTLRIEAAIPNALATTSNFFANRRFANLTIANNQTVTGDFFYNVDNLTIENGSTFYIKGSGATAISGNVLNNGTMGSVAGFTSSNLLMKGITPQSIGGTGTFLPFGAVSVGAAANVTLNANVVINGSTNSLINGKINLNTHTYTGTGTFQTKAAASITTAATAGVVGSYSISLDPAAYSSTANTAGVYNGLLVTGTGVPANSFIIGTSSSSSTITISNPLTTTPSSITISGGIPELRTSSPNGIDGNIAGVGTLSVSSSTDLVFDAPTTQPFSNIATGTYRNVTFNAAVTTNRNLILDSVLTVNAGILSIRPVDTIRIKNGKDLGGAPFNNAKHIATLSSAAGVGMLRIDLVSTPKLFPIGSVANYLPVTLSPSAVSTFTAGVFEGVTVDGATTGTLLTSAELSKLVNSVWKLNRVSGTGDALASFGWTAALEGTIFAAQANPRIGVIQNTASVWSTPSGTGDNTLNTASSTITSFGAFAIGSQPLVSAFSFNALQPIVYGNPDFNAGVTSLNTTQPLIYTSSNTSVATISASGLIHIVGAGTTNINVTQATDGTYLAANETQPLVVNKAPLTITADNQSRFEGVVNPTLTASYSGFVYSETPAVLQTPVTLSTTAVLASTPGAYPITASGATAANYNIAFVSGTLTVIAKQNQTITFGAFPTVTYGAPDFSAPVSSTNNTIPVSLSSSNNGVAIINGNNIQITGAGTTTITASQAGNEGYFPANDVSITLIVNKAPLTIGVRDTSKLEGQVNPTFTFVYTGFVLGETASALSSQPVVITTATQNSLAGIYTITPSDAQANNYEIAYTSGRMIIYPADSASQTLQAYYNGSNGVRVKLFSPFPDKGDVIFYDMLGRRLSAKSIYLPSGFTELTLPVKGFGSALYIISFKGTKNTISKQIPIIQ